MSTPETHIKEELEMSNVSLSHKLQIIQEHAVLWDISIK